MILKTIIVKMLQEIMNTRETNGKKKAENLSEEIEDVKKNEIENLKENHNK